MLIHLDVYKIWIRSIVKESIPLKKEPGIFAIQNAISTMLRILIPVNNPSVPPKIKKNVLSINNVFPAIKKAHQMQQVCLQMSSFYP